MFLTRGYHALASDFALAVEDDDLGRHLAWLLDGFVEPTSPTTEYHVEPGDFDDDDDNDDVKMTLDGEMVLSASSRDSFVAALVQWLNQRAVDPDYTVTSHAGGVERDGLACVLPADPESGKTTLTTGLVRAGFAYLSDEAIAFDHATGAIEPYPKPLSIDPGSQFLFPELEPPTLVEPDADDDPRQWQVPPASIRADAVGGPCRARYVVFPKYDRDTATALEPISRAEALVELAKNTFRFREDARRGLDTLSRVVREVDCYRLAVGDLDSACKVIDELMGGARNG